MYAECLQWLIRVQEKKPRESSGLQQSLFPPVSKKLGTRA